MTQIMTSMERFSPAGRIKANEIIAEMTSHGIEAKIDATWMDYGAGMAWETILVYSKSIKMWYQALTPADFASINAGGTPPNYRGMIEQAKG